MIVAVAAFSGMDALLKVLAGSYPPMQVAVLRGMASLPFLLAPIALSGRWQLLRPRRFPMHVLRGALQVLVLGCFIYAVRTLSLANVYAVFLSAPLLMTALSVPILKERTDARGWLVIIVGLIGVIIMVRPSATGFGSLGAIAALIAALAYAVSGITVRVLTRTDSTASVVVWTISLMTRVRPRAGTAALGDARATALPLAPPARGAGGRRLLRPDGGVPLGAGRGGVAAGVHRAPVGDPDRPGGVARAAERARMLWRCRRDRQRSVSDLARAAPGEAGARLTVMEVAQRARQNVAPIFAG